MTSAPASAEARGLGRAPRRGPLAVVWLAAWLGALALAGAPPAGAQSLEVIELRYRLAEEVLPALQPLVEPGGALTGTDRVLFVRASPANLAEIRAAVAALDRRPRQLEISVGQGTTTGAAGAAVRGAASVGSGDVQAGIGAPPVAGTGIAVAAGAGTRQAGLRNVASVRALEGSEAWIALGQVVPVTTTQVVPGPHGPVGYASTGQRDVSTGFYATARVSGEFVTLDLAPRQQRLRDSPAGPVVATAGTTTTVSGRLGEWIPIGAVAESGSGDSAGLLRWGRRSEQSQYVAWVRVEEVP